MNPFALHPKSNRRRQISTLPVICLPLIASFFYFVWYPGTRLGNSFYVGMKMLMVVWPILAVWVILKEKLFDDPRPAQHQKGLLVGGIFGVITVLLLFGLMKLTPVGPVVYANAQRITQRVTDLGVKEHFLLFTLFVSIIHAALEEYFWRWFAFGQLRKMVSVPVAVIIASVGFAAHHVVVLTQFLTIPLAIILGSLVGFGGAVWCALYHRFNSLWGPWFSHMLIDFGIMWVGWEILKTAP
jgi:uncharacterized protein